MNLGRLVGGLRRPGRIFAPLRRSAPAALGLLLAMALLAGCSVRPVPVRPERALAIALTSPEVAAWHEAHSAPRVLEGMLPAAARNLTRYKPVAMVDLGREGLFVRFASAFGPRPRRIEVIVDKESGEVLKVTRR